MYFDKDLLNTGLGNIQQPGLYSDTTAGHKCLPEVHIWPCDERYHLEGCGALLEKQVIRGGQVVL